jgi:hypothetical protein
MLNDSEIIKLRNTVNGTVVYTVPDMNNLVRTFQPNEIKKVTMEEVRKLSYEPGGMALLNNYLAMDNKEAIEEILGVVEPEYYYTTEDIKTLLSPKGSLAQLEDFLNFAPDGMKEALKNMAVDTKLNDVAKRDLILQKLHFNVTKAIELLADDGKDTVAPAPNARKAAPIAHEEAASTAPVRKYNVVG